MPNEINTLYPPQVPTFAKAFIYNQDVRIPCGISPYNNVGEIRCVHLTITNQLNNENALKNSWGVLFLDLKSDDQGNYWVDVPASAMKNNHFNINQFYKVQLRFDNKFKAAEWNIVQGGNDSGSTSPSAPKITEQLLAYQTNFSEWSTVCLIRGILKPEVVLTGFQGEDTPTYNKGIIPITGKMFFMKDNGEASLEETETLQSYSIHISPRDDLKNIILFTDTVYTNGNIDPNVINHRIDLQGKSLLSNELTLKIKYTTRDQYSGEQLFDFTIADYLNEESFQPIITATVNNEKALVEVSVENRETVFGTLYIKRASGEDGYTNWEIVRVEKVEGPIRLTMVDDTVMSMNWYRYSVQLENSKHALTQIFRSDTVFPEFYDAVFTRDGRSLKLNYNFQVSNMKPVVNRAKIDTLGGRYPKFAENAVMNYKQFSISGLISSESDVYQMFLQKSKYFKGNTYNRYQHYLLGAPASNEPDPDKAIDQIVRNDVPDYVLKDNSQTPSYRTTTYKDWLWDRAFREEAMQWLNDGEPKLFRTMAEGNIAVMLTDINLTPETVLGRRLYSFSATAYEVADGTSLEVLDSLGIYPIQRPDEEAGFGSGPDTGAYKQSKPQGMHDFIIPDRNSIITVIREELESRYGGVLADKQPSDITLRNVKIQFMSEPHIYYINADQTLTEVASTSTSAGSNSLTGKDPTRMQRGYVITLTTNASSAPNTIFVPASGYYQVPAHIVVEGLSFYNVGDMVHMEYIMDFNERNDSSSIASNASLKKTLLGQERNVFQAGQYLGDRIRRKYTFVKTGQFTQNMKYWMGISVDAPPFTVVSIRYYREHNYNDYMIGSTGFLKLLKDVPIQDMYFKGKRMTKVSIDRQRYLDQHEFVVDDTAYDSIDAVKKPQRNTVYNIDGKNKIFYSNGRWYDFEIDSSTTGLAKVPTDGIVNYVGQVMKTTY